MIKPKEHKKKIFVASVFLIAVIFEVFIFNYQFFITPGNGKYELLDIDDITVTGVEEYNGGYRSTGTSVTLELKDINAPVKTMGLHLNFKKGYKCSYSFDFADSSNSSYSLRSGKVTGSVVNRSKKSEVVYFQSSGNVDKLKIRLTLPKDTVIFFDHDSFTLNEKVPFSFNANRVLLILSVIYLIAFLLTSDICKQSISDTRTSVRTCTVCVAMCCILIAFILCIPSSNGIVKDFTKTSGDQITYELVEAFEHGQLHLLREVEESLLALENPYDWSQRTEAGVSYAWDHVMYQGKYYSYYGIAPVILLFLPYHLITGYYFPAVWAVFIFGAAGLLFLCLAYKEFMKRLFPNIPYGMYLAGLLTAVSSCGIWFCFMTPQFYEIAQNSGFAFVTLGAYLLFSSGILENSKISYVRLGLSSASLATAVLCRPTTAVWCIAAVVFIIYGFIRALKSLTVGKRVAYILTSALPFILIGGSQMIYNYLRFDSPTDFGIQYSLTINDFTVSEFSPNMAFIGFYNFLFAFPIINDIFPFIHSNFSDLNINGYYFIANRIAVGLFFRALPVLGIFAVPKAFVQSEKKKCIFPAIIWLLCVVILPCIVIYSIWESGYGVRYCVDFSWQMLLGGLSVLFLLYNRSKSTFIYRFVTLSSVPAILIGVTTGLEYLSERAYFAQTYDILKIAFEFWH